MIHREGLSLFRLPLMTPQACKAVELSAKLTEGEPFNAPVNMFADTVKIAVNIQIANPQCI